MALVVRLLLIAVVLAVLSGCSAKPQPVAEGAAPQPTPYERVRSGAFQLNIALTAMESSYKSAQEAQELARGDKLNGPAVDKLVDMLNAAGSRIGDYAVAPPSPADFSAHAAEQEQRRQQAVAAAIASQRQIEDGLTVVSRLQDTAGERLKPKLAELSTSLVTANDALKGAVQAFGS
jgi:hypothetical protein